MPDRPVHPDREELAAWQAGALADPASGRIGAHLAGCADCAEVVATVERGRTALASLEEPEVPPNLHERLAAMIEREAPARAPEPAAGASRGRAVGGRRRWAWSPRRVAALGAAAALVLLVAGLVPVLLHTGGGTGTQAAGGATAPPKAERAMGAGGALPVFAAPGGYSGGQLRSAVAGDPAVRDAYARAAGAQSQAASNSAAPGSADEGVPSVNSGQRSLQSEGATGRDAATAVDQQACVVQVRARSSEEVRAAFFVDTVYRGRPATVLVTRRAAAPDQAELWAFPRGDCSTAPYASERVQVPPP